MYLHGYVSEGTSPKCIYVVLSVVHEQQRCLRRDIGDITILLLVPIDTTYWAITWLPRVTTRRWRQEPR